MPRPNAPWYRSSKDCWYIKIGGKCLSLGVRGKDSSAAALAAFHKKLSQPLSTAAGEVGRNTLSELKKKFFEEASSRLKAKTVACYREGVDPFCAFCGDVGADAVTKQLVTEWLASLPVSPTTKAIRLRSVSAFLGWCVREELLEDNPAKKVLRPKGRSRSVEAVISGGDHEKLLGGAHPTLVPVIRLLYETGCRPGEIGKMTVENYHPDAAVFRLTEHKADKTGKVRNVFLPPDLNEFVKEVAAKRKSGVMFLTKRKTAWRAGAITLAMDRLRKKVGVSAVAYGYRHGFAHRALSGGESDSVVAALMGHSDTKMIHLHYSHLNENAVAMRAAVTRLSKTAGKCE